MIKFFPKNTIYCARSKADITCCISILDFSVQALSTRNVRPPISYPFKFRIALNAVSWSLYSQKPYPFGLPLSRSNTNLKYNFFYQIMHTVQSFIEKNYLIFRLNFATHFKERTGPTSLKISFNFSSVASYGMFPTVKLQIYVYIPCTINEEKKIWNFVEKMHSPNTDRMDLSMILWSLFFSPIFTVFNDQNTIKKLNKLIEKITATFYFQQKTH